MHCSKNIVDEGEEDTIKTPSDKLLQKEKFLNPVRKESQNNKFPSKVQEELKATLRDKMKELIRKDFEVSYLQFTYNVKCKILQSLKSY